MSILTPQQLRDRIASFYEASFRRATGAEVNRAAIERKVIADLELVDAARRSGSLVEHSGRSAAVAPERTERAKAATPKPGSKSTRYRPGMLFKNPLDVSYRWACCVARIMRLCEGIGGSSKYEHAADNAEIPTLARRVIHTYCAYMTRATPAPLSGVDDNPFRGMSDGDASRAFMRAMEDIADESSGRLGPWLVPK